METSKNKKEHRLIFQHIPKTAGTSIIPLFTNQFERDHIFLCGSKDGVLNDFLSLGQEKRDRLKLLLGHVDFGIHKIFNGESKYIAFLRDPIERVVSHYFFIRSYSGHRYHKQAMILDLKAFIMQGIRPRMNNCITRMISGENPDYGKCHSSMVDHAIENIENHYIFLGDVTHFSTSVNQLMGIMCWESVVLKRKNTNNSRPSMATLTEDEIDVIRQYNSLDIRLFKIIQSTYFTGKKDAPFSLNCCADL